MHTIKQLIWPFFFQFGLTDALSMEALVTSDSYCCSVEGFGHPLKNTELTATSFHLTEWNFPGSWWRTQKLTPSPQILSLSPQALRSSSRSHKCSDKKMIAHKFPTRQHCQIGLMGCPLDGLSHFHLYSLCNFVLLVMLRLCQGGHSS